MPTMLQPSCTATLGTQEWSQQILRVDVELAFAPGLNRAVLRFPASVPLSASAGDPAEVKLSHDDADGPVVSGTVLSIRRALDAITVVVGDASGTLARFRPAVTYEQATAGTVVRSLADETGVDTGDIEDGVALAYYVADPSRTALEHIARVANWSGAMASVSDSGKLETRVIQASQAEVALLYGREILRLDENNWPSAIEGVTVAGESGAGSASAPEVHRPTTDFFAGNRPDGPSLKQRWKFEPALRTAEGAATAGASLMRGLQAAGTRVTVDAWLLPAMRPGVVLEIQELPDGLSSGPFWVWSVRHRLDAHGGFTRLELRMGGDDFDPLALLGSLGSLL